MTRFRTASILVCNLLLGIVVVTGPVSGQDSKAVSEAVEAKIETAQQFQTVFDFIRSSGTEEKWRQIGWIPSLWDGIQIANAKQKPIFVWAMNGDPLGCV